MLTLSVHHSTGGITCGKMTRIRTGNRKHAAVQNIYNGKSNEITTESITTHTVAEESMHSQLRQTMAALSSVVSSNYAGRAELYTTKRIFYGEVVSPLAMYTVWGLSKAGVSHS